MRSRQDYTDSLNTQTLRESLALTGGAYQDFERLLSHIKDVYLDNLCRPVEANETDGWARLQKRFGPDFLYDHLQKTADDMENFLSFELNVDPAISDILAKFMFLHDAGKAYAVDPQALDEDKVRASQALGERVNNPDAAPATYDPLLGKSLSYVYTPEQLLQISPLEGEQYNLQREHTTFGRQLYDTLLPHFRHLNGSAHSKFHEIAHRMIANHHDPLAPSPVANKNALRPSFQTDFQDTLTVIMHVAKTIDAYNGDIVQRPHHDRAREPQEALARLHTHDKYGDIDSSLISRFAYWKLCKDANGPKSDAAHNEFLGLANIDARTDPQPHSTNANKPGASR